MRFGKTKMTKTLVAAAVTLGLTTGTNVQAVDLVDVYQMALENDPQLRLARAQLQGTSETKTQAFANFLPQIDGSGTYSETEGSFTLVNGTSGDIDSSRENFTLTLNQTIYNHANYTRLDAARARVSQAEADYEVALDDFAVRVAERYFAVLTAEDGLAFAQAEEKANSRQLEQADQRYEVGLTAITDVHEARSAYDRARADAIIAQNTLDDALEALRELTGQYVAELDPVVEELPLQPPQPADMEAWTEQAIQNNPQVQSSEFAAESALQNIRTERSGHFPTVGAQVTYSDTTNDGDLGAFSTETSDNTTIGIRVDVPIFSGFSTSSLVRQRQYEYEAALERLEVDRRQVLRQTRNDYRAVLAGISQVEAFGQAVVSAQSALEATEAGFEVGTRTIVDVLISQRSLFQAQQNYSRARHDYLVNQLRLEASAGVLDADDLQEINALLK